MYNILQEVFYNIFNDTFNKVSGTKLIGGKMKIAIVGTGNVGTSLGSALIDKRYEIVYGSRNPDSTSVPNGARVKSQADAVAESDVVIMAIPHGAVKDTVEAIGAERFAGKTVIDVTNVYDENMRWVSGPKSAAEELAEMIPDARVVKAFNTVFAKEMRTGSLNGEKLTLLVAGDDAEAKNNAKNIGESIGFEVVDAGQLSNAKYLEALGVLNMELAFNQKISSEVAFKLVKG